MQIISHGAYGLSWPDKFSKFQAELALYCNDELRESTKKSEEKHVHFRNAIKEVFPEKYLVWHKWFEQAVESWCYDAIASEWGASAMGKSSDYGVIALVDVLAAPSDTLSVFITNPLKMHHERCFKYVKMYHSLLPKHFQWLSERKQDPLGMLFDHQKASQGGKVYPARLSGVVCFSNKPGDSMDDMKRRIGSHLPRMRLIVDEPQGCSLVVLDLMLNMAAGEGVDFRERFLGNPSLKSDPLSQHSRPDDDDWEKTQYLDDWTTARVYKGKKGRCFVRDGRKSPAIEDPKKYWFLAGASNISDAKANKGEDSVEFQTYAIGRLLLHGGKNVAITEQDLEALDAYRKVIWETSWEDYAGLDPASEGRDGNSMCRIRVGKEAGGRTVASIIERANLDIDPNKPDKSGQIAQQVLTTLARWNIPIDRLAGDVTGNQGPICDRIESESKSGKRIYRIQASGKCSSESPIFVGSTVKRCERYFTRATELFFNVVIACQHKQLTLAFPNGEQDTDSIYQLTSRQLVVNPEKLRGRTQVEPKDEWRKRNSGKSPDDLDGIQQVLAMLVEKGILVLNEGADQANRRQNRNHHQRPTPMQRKQKRKQMLRRY